MHTDCASQLTPSAIATAATAGTTPRPPEGSGAEESATHQTAPAPTSPTNPSAPASDINVDSLWLIGERDKSGKHSNVYHGNFIPQIPNQFLRRYTKEGETVLELFSGSGTTLFECETLKRRFIGFDINTEMIKTVRAKMENSQAKFQINECDVTNSADFSTAMNHSLSALRTTQMQFLIAHPVYTKCEVVPLGSYVLDAIKRNFKVKLRGIFA